MKRALAVIAVMLFSSTVALAANPWSEVDAEAREVTAFLRSMLGSEFEETMQEDYPDAVFEWGARAMPSSPIATYVVHCNTTENGKDIGYHYFEVTIAGVNGNAELEAKYL